MEGSWSKETTEVHKNPTPATDNTDSTDLQESFSLLKRGIMGTWHKISAKHLAAYLEEITFRFNRRKNPDLFVDTLRHMITADPLTFENLTKDAA